MDLTTFQFELTRIPVRTADESRLASAVDVCDGLGYERPANAWVDIKARNPEIRKSVKSRSVRALDGKLRETDFLDLDGVIRLCLLSRGPRAEAFRDWAVKILRREIEATQDFVMPRLDAAFFQAVTDRMRALETQVAALEPKAATYDALTTSPDTISVGDLAKLIGVGPNWLFSKLRHDGVFQDHPHRNIPYATDENRKRFAVRESPWTHPKTGETRITLVVGVYQYGVAWALGKYGAVQPAEVPAMIGGAA